MANIKIIFTVTTKNQPKLEVTANWAAGNHTPTFSGKRTQVKIKATINNIEVIKTGGLITKFLLSSNFLNMSYTI
ncbi:hypothetical protein MODO_0169 [Myroides odoratimimus]|nr:hypothetical protein MODO_0169 [Myroides odoratimimus]